MTIVAMMMGKVEWRWWWRRSW